MSVTPFMSVPTLPNSVLRLVTSPAAPALRVDQNSFHLVNNRKTYIRNRSFPLVISVMVSSSRLCRKGAFLLSFPRLCKKGVFNGQLRCGVCHPLHVCAHASRSVLRLVTSPDSSNTACRSKNFHLVNTSKTYSRNRSFPLVIAVMVSSSRLCRKGEFLSSFPRLCKTRCF
jgi:hypothetical protein